jgi:hypothetical protein
MFSKSMLLALFLVFTFEKLVQYSFKNSLENHNLETIAWNLLFYLWIQDLYLKYQGWDIEHKIPLESKN